MCSLVQMVLAKVSAWKVFHFHDTSDTAGVKRLSAVHDNDNLRADASNLAAFLYRLKNETPNVYGKLIQGCENQ